MGAQFRAPSGFRWDEPALDEGITQPDCKKDKHYSTQTKD